ncbi:MAG: response regulator transcription factor [Armatimonadota bacterium]
MNSTVVVAEADDDLRDHLQRELEAEGLCVVCARTGGELLRLAELNSPDLILLAVTLPDASGFEIAQRLRFITDAPVLLMGVVSPLEEQLPDAGGNVADYVTRPFRVTEVVVRSLRLLRSRPARERARAAAGRDQRRALSLGDLSLDLQRHRLTVRGREIPLPPSQATLLRVLIEHAPRVVSPELLVARSQPWLEGDYGELGDAIMGLRAAIEEDPLQPRRILHVPGYGYRIVPVEQGAEPAGEGQESAAPAPPGHDEEPLGETSL